MSKLGGRCDVRWRVVVLAVTAVVVSAGTAVDRTLAMARPLDAGQTADDTCLLVPRFDDRCEAWTASHAGGTGEAVWVDAVGDALYVLGTAANAWGQLVVYDAASGVERRSVTFAAPPGFTTDRRDVVLSNDQRSVFMTGYAIGEENGDHDYATVAYDVETGARRWLALYDGPAGGIDIAKDLAVSPDGHRIYVTGESEATRHPDVYAARPDYFTVVYDAATGETLSTARFGGMATDRARRVAISPSGDHVYVAGMVSRGVRVCDYATCGERFEYTTVAYDKQLREIWIAAQVDDAPTRDYGDYRATPLPLVHVAPDGERVYLSGVGTRTEVADPVFAPQARKVFTVAYDARTGEELWTRRFYSIEAAHVPRSLSVSQDRLFLATVNSRGADALRSFDVATGRELWRSDFASYGLSTSPVATAVSHDGRYLYVGGVAAIDNGWFSGQEYLTKKFDARNGEVVWQARSQRLGTEYDVPAAITVAPNDAQVYVTGGFSLYSGVKFGTVSFETTSLPTTNRLELNERAV